MKSNSSQSEQEAARVHVVSEPLHAAGEARRLRVHCAIRKTTLGPTIVQIDVIVAQLQRTAIVNALNSQRDTLNSPVEMSRSAVCLTIFSFIGSSQYKSYQVL